MILHSSNLTERKWTCLLSKRANFPMLFPISVKNNCIYLFSRQKSQDTISFSSLFPDLVANCSITDTPDSNVILWSNIFFCCILYIPISYLKFFMKQGKTETTKKLCWVFFFFTLAALKHVPCPHPLCYCTGWDTHHFLQRIWHPNFFQVTSSPMYSTLFLHCPF